MMFSSEFRAPVFGGSSVLWGYDNAVESGAIYEQHDFDNALHRYALWRIWDAASKPLVVIGLNPSTATHFASDPTVRRDLCYAREWGYGGLIKLNLFSYRATDPRDMIEAHGAGVDITGGKTNDDYLEWFCDGTRAGLVLCAWGAHGTLLNRGSEVASLLLNNGYRLYALALTKTGEPGHTLYLSKTLKPQPFTLQGE